MTVRPKILIFSLTYHPFVGGAEVAIKEITDRLGDDFSASGGPVSGGEFSFDMITANLDGRQKSEEQIGKVKVHRILFLSGRITKYLFPWLAYRQAVKLHRENHYDMIWAMMANQAGWAALKFKNKFPSVKYLLTLQEGDSGWDIWWRTFFIRPIYKNIYRRADRIQAISNFLAYRAKKLGAKCEIDIIPNGIEIPNFKSHPPQATDKSQTQNSKKIITVSRLVKKNGIKNLIESFQIMVTRYSLPVTLIIVGDGILRSALEKLTKDLKIDQQLEFVGNIPNQQVYQHLSQADVFCRPSLSEGLGNSFLEAMAVKIPVIATPVGGIPDFLKDGETGWFCKVKDPASIAEKINYILDPKNKEEVERVVENAYNLVIKKYNWNDIAFSIKNIFNKLINE